MKKIKKVVLFVLLIGIIVLIYAISGWIWTIICIMIVALFWDIVYSLKSPLFSDKEVGKEIKDFLGYDFGNEYEVIVNDVRGHQDWPVKFMIKIPQDRMQNVIEYCKSSELGKCSAKEFTKEFTKMNTKLDYPEWNKNLTVHFDECTIEYSSVSF